MFSVVELKTSLRLVSAWISLEIDSIVTARFLPDVSSLFIIPSKHSAFLHCQGLKALWPQSARCGWFHQNGKYFGLTISNRRWLCFLLFFSDRHSDMEDSSGNKPYVVTSSLNFKVTAPSFYNQPKKFASVAPPRPKSQTPPSGPSPTPVGTAVIGWVGDLPPPPPSLPDGICIIYVFLVTIFSFISRAALPSPRPCGFFFSCTAACRASRLRMK